MILFASLSKNLSNGKKKKTHNKKIFLKLLNMKKTLEYGKDFRTLQGGAMLG